MTITKDGLTIEIADDCNVVIEGGKITVSAKRPEIHHRIEVTSHTDPRGMARNFIDSVEKLNGRIAPEPEPWETFECGCAKMQNPDGTETLGFPITDGIFRYLRQRFGSEMGDGYRYMACYSTTKLSKSKETHTC